MQRLPEELSHQIRTTRRIVGEKLEQLANLEGARARALALKKIDATIAQLGPDLLGRAVDIDIDEPESLGSPIASWRVIALARGLNFLTQLNSGLMVLDGGKTYRDQASLFFSWAVMETASVAAPHSAGWIQEELNRDLFQQGLRGNWSIISLRQANGRTFAELFSANLDLQFEMTLAGQYVHLHVEGAADIPPTWMTRAKSDDWCRLYRDRQQSEANELIAKAAEKLKNVEKLQTMLDQYTKRR